MAGFEGDISNDSEAVDWVLGLLYASSPEEEMEMIERCESIPELTKELISELRETIKPDRPYSEIPAFEYRHDFTNYDALLERLPEAIVGEDWPEGSPEDSDVCICNHIGPDEFLAGRIRTLCRNYAEAYFTLKFEANDLNYSKRRAARALDRST